jgi:HAD superfamily hydrolase (TIGR01509 family)
VTGARRYRAVVFDMDGVLTDSEPAFYAAVNDILVRYGTHIPMHEYQRFIGSATPDMWRGVIALKQLPLTLDEVIDAYEAPLMERLRQPRPALDGARELLDALRGRGVPVALCTASYSRWVDAILASAGLHGRFDALSTADMVERTKPDPAPYALAAEKLGVRPADCIAIEDSANGIASAIGAGMRVFQLRATGTAAPPVDGATVISALGEVPLELLSGNER